MVNRNLVSSLFLFHVGSNTGYAIAPLERLFYKVGLALAQGDSRKIHFAYPNLDNGLPDNLPTDLTNVIQFDFKHTSSATLERLGAYANQNHIRLVIAFDLQPVHPICKALRKADVATIISYWGAPISSLMPLWRLLPKKLQIVTSRSKVDGLIFESNAMAHLATHGRGVPSRMIYIVPLGVDTRLFKPMDSEYVYEVFGFPPGRKVVLYSGHMERRKGVHVLIGAAIDLLIKRQRKDVCFLLCGNTGNQSEEYESMFSGLGIDDLIRFGGYRNDMPKLYASSYCGVIPSSGWDSFTLTSLEMAACGLPIIASRLHGLPEAVLDQKTGLLCEAGNLKMLADCIEKLLDNSSLAAEYGRRGRLRCEREFNLKVQEERFLTVLRKRIGQSYSYK